MRLSRRAVTGVRAVVALAAVGAALAVAAPGASAADAPPGSVWSLGKEFSANARGAHANPFADRLGNARVWSMLGAPGVERKPAGYALLSTFVGTGCGGANPSVVSWNGATPEPVALATTGKATINGGSCGPNQVIAPNAAYVHPSSAPASAVIGWKSPVSGTVTIAGTVTDADCGGGNGVLWALSHNATDLATGTVANCGKERIKGRTATVKRGDSLYVAIDPNGEYTYDLTRIDLTITLTGGGSGGAAAGATGSGGATAGWPVPASFAPRQASSGKWKFNDLTSVQAEAAKATGVAVTVRKVGFAGVPEKFRADIGDGEVFAVDPAPGTALNGTLRAPAKLTVQVYDEEVDLAGGACPYKGTIAVKGRPAATLRSVLKGERLADAIGLLERLKCDWAVVNTVRSTSVADDTVRDLNVAEVRNAAARGYRVAMVVERPVSNALAVVVGPRDAADVKSNPGLKKAFASELTLGTDLKLRAPTKAGAAAGLTSIRVGIVSTANGRPVAKAAVALYDVDGTPLATVATGLSGDLTLTAPIRRAGVVRLVVSVTDARGLVTEGERAIQVVADGKLFTTLDGRCFAAGASGSYAAAKCPVTATAATAAVTQQLGKLGAAVSAALGPDALLRSLWEKGTAAASISVGSGVAQGIGSAVGAAKTVTGILAKANGSTVKQPVSAVALPTSGTAAPLVTWTGNRIGIAPGLGVDMNKAIDPAKSLLVPKGGKLIGNDGSTLIGLDGGTLIGLDGSTLIGLDGSTLRPGAGLALLPVTKG